MTAFVEVSSVAGALFLPADLVRPVPLTEQQWADRRLLTCTAEDFAVLDADGAVEAVAAARRLRARADAAEARAVARLAAVRGRDSSVAKEVALEARISETAAATRIARGTDLVHRMPLLLAAMDAGDIEGFPAGKIVEATAMLDNSQARQVDELLAAKLVSGRLQFTDPYSLVRATRRLVENVDPDGQSTRARKARAGRKVVLTPQDNGMATLSADLPAEVAASAYARVDAMARRLRNGGDHRSLEQLRADVYAALLLGQDPGAGAPRAAAVVFLHMPIDTALTMSDTGCELAGYGPLPAAIAREIMTNPNSMIRKVLTDPASGAVRDLGRTRRRPSAFLRDFVAARDRECATPGCHRPAQRCDFDHLQEWGDLGITSDTNGGAKCERDHYRKDQPGWTLTHHPGSGTSTITTPTGRTYTKTIQPITEPKPAQSTPDIPRPRPHAPHPTPASAPRGSGGRRLSS
ncbi:protein of unknown function [Amycolatopsis marina]|uniref:DUF222 domain-containing protein n=1 Tax=Amycolatopsis marina TaxID=490629 RepID=A0A1I1CA41_9PSEU|nr:DUF222 domain-containing protein [Amycolatopsis marina]SFB57620.1 protein of unknown function [Amycolatopsis marina]